MIGEQQRRVDVERRVRKELERIGLYRLPVNPVVVANRLGMKVIGAEFEDSSIISVITSEDRGRDILVADSETPYRKRFAVAHALGHYFLHFKDGHGTEDEEEEMVDRTHNMSWGRERAGRITQGTRWRRTRGRRIPKRHRKETEANWFATELVMPEEFFLEEWSWKPSVWRMARVFNVPEEAIEYRLDDLGFGFSQ